jgi:membrane-bound lysozyme inhibitor of c-type lysozyme MliC
MTGQRLLVIGLLCTASAACASHKIPERVTESRNYNGTFLCDGSQQVQVRFTPFKAELESPDATVEMTQQPARDGFLYVAGGQSLRAHGAEATWTDGGGAVHHCREVISLPASVAPATR